MLHARCHSSWLMSYHTSNMGTEKACTLEEQKEWWFFAPYKQCFSMKKHIIIFLLCKAWWHYNFAQHISILFSWCSNLSIYCVMDSTLGTCNDCSVIHVRWMFISLRMRQVLTIFQHDKQFLIFVMDEAYGLTLLHTNQYSSFSSFIPSI